MSKINFNTINRAIHGIRGSDRYSEFEKKEQDLSVKFSLAREKFSTANRMNFTTTVPTRTVGWYNEFDTQEHIICDDTPTVAELD
jgi:hypothetical protein